MVTLAGFGSLTSIKARHMKTKHRKQKLQVDHFHLQNSIPRASLNNKFFGTL